MPQSNQMKKARKIIRDENPTLETVTGRIKEIDKRLKEAYDYYWWSIENLKWDSDPSVEQAMLRSERFINDLNDEMAIASIVFIRVKEGLTDAQNYDTTRTDEYIKRTG